MNIKSLSASHFRNLRDVQIEFKKGVSVFIGDNGQGKTNLLEAIFCLTRGYSFRTPKSAHLIDKENDFALISGRLETRNLVNDVKFQLTQAKKNFFLNNKKVMASKIVDLFPSVLFSPESLAAIKEGPGFRRVLLDELLSLQSLENSKILADYNKCLRMRNKVLKDYKGEKSSHDQTRDVLGSIDGSFLPIATKLTLLRINALRQLLPDFTEATRYILDRENVDITVEYIISSEKANNWQQKEVYYALLKRRDELCESEMASGMTLVGPHRHDIQFLFEKEDSRYYCSQGQQRALILAFKMAQIMYYYRVHQDCPLLLLDDVLSELDPRRRSNLVKFLNKLDSQIVVTTTDLDFQKDFGRENVNVFRLSQGEVSWDGQ